MVEKFEEVEYEGVMEEMWLNMQVDEESWEMEQRKQDFQVECHKAQPEDEVWLLKGRVWHLEGELKIAHAENEYALLKKQDEMDGIVEGMLVELEAEHREELLIEGGNVRKSGDLLIVATNSRRAAVSPSEAMLLACEDMLKEADQRAEQDHHVLESTLHGKEDAESMFQWQQFMWHEREHQLESQILTLDKVLSRISDKMAEAESGLVIKQECHKEAWFEADGLLKTCREEKKMCSDSQERWQRLVEFLVKIRENLMKEAGDDLQGRLRTLLQELEQELQRANSRRSNEISSGASESEQDNWKAQRDQAETERDKLEAKLDLQFRRARDREREIEAMWSEREKDLVARCSHLEFRLTQWEAQV